MPEPLKKLRRRKQAGSALLLVIFMVATMLLLTTTAVLRIDTQGQREHEREMIWRGEQYQRAIGKYFRKFGKYPTKVDDLVKQTNGVRFLRQAYPDPTNKEDGSWRFIYLGPGGQLIGSLRRTSLLQTLITAPPQPVGASPFGPISGPGGPGGAQGTSGQPSNGLQTFNPVDSQPQSLTGPVIGGNIIGVAGKVDQKSLRVYEGGDSYQTWEFIWNPMLNGGTPGQLPNQLPATGPTTAPGMPMPGFGQTAPGGAGTPPQPNP